MTTSVALTRVQEETAAAAAAVMQASRPKLNLSSGVSARMAQYHEAAAAVDAKPTRKALGDRTNSLSALVVDTKLALANGKMNAAPPPSTNDAPAATDTAAPAAIAAAPPTVVAPGEVDSTGVLTPRAAAAPVPQAAVVAPTLVITPRAVDPAATARLHSLVITNATLEASPRPAGRPVESPATTKAIAIAESRLAYVEAREESGLLSARTIATMKAEALVAAAEAYHTHRAGGDETDARRRPTRPLRGGASFKPSVIEQIEGTLRHRDPATDVMGAPLVLDGETIDDLKRQHDAAAAAAAPRLAAQKQAAAAEEAAVTDGELGAPSVDLVSSLRGGGTPEPRNYWEVKMVELYQVAIARCLKKPHESWRASCGPLGNRANIIAALRRLDDEEAKQRVRTLQGPPPPTPETLGYALSTPFAGRTTPAAATPAATLPAKVAATLAATPAATLAATPASTLPATPAATPLACGLSTGLGISAALSTPVGGSVSPYAHAAWSEKERPAPAPSGTAVAPHDAYVAALFPATSAASSPATGGTDTEATDTDASSPESAPAAAVMAVAGAKTAPSAKTPGSRRSEKKPRARPLRAGDSPLKLRIKRGLGMSTASPRSKAASIARLSAADAAAVHAAKQAGVKVRKARVTGASSSDEEGADEGLEKPPTTRIQMGDKSFVVQYRHLPRASDKPGVAPMATEALATEVLAKEVVAASVAAAVAKKVAKAAAVAEVATSKVSNLREDEDLFASIPDATAMAETMPQKSKRAVPKRRLNLAERRGGSHRSFRAVNAKAVAAEEAEAVPKQVEVLQEVEGVEVYSLAAGVATSLDAKAAGRGPSPAASSGRRSPGTADAIRLDLLDEMESALDSHRSESGGLSVRRAALSDEATGAAGAAGISAERAAILSSLSFLSADSHCEGAESGAESPPPNAPLPALSLPALRVPAGQRESAPPLQPLALGSLAAAALPAGVLASPRGTVSPRASPRRRAGVSPRAANALGGLVTPRGTVLALATPRAVVASIAKSGRRLMANARGKQSSWVWKSKPAPEAKPATTSSTRAALPTLAESPLHADSPLATPAGAPADYPKPATSGWFVKW